MDEFEAQAARNAQARKRPQTARESQIQKRIMEWLQALGPDCHARNVHGGAYGVSGQPDITGCIRGRRFDIEVKRPGQNPRPNQVREMALWEAAGSVVFVARSLQDVQQKFSEEGLI